MPVIETQHENLSAYTPSYQLLEEARKSWDHSVCDKFIYGLDPRHIDFDSPIHISKDYAIVRNSWIEAHLTFHCDGYPHFQVIIEAIGHKRSFVIPPHHSSDSMHGNSHVLVDIAKFVQLPEKMIVNIPSLVRLKRFDHGSCICGHSVSAPIKEIHIGRFENWELGIFRIAQGEFCERPDKMVKRRSQILKSIPRYKRNFVRSISELGPDDVQLFFSVILSDKSMGIRFAEQSYFLLEDFKVFFRPTCLQIGIGKAGISHSQ